MSANLMFQPTGGAASTNSIAATTTSGTSSRRALPAQSLTNTIRFFNDATVTCYVAMGDSSVVATVPTAGGAAGSLPIGPGTTEVLGLGGVTHIAAITATGTATLNYTLGEGV